MKTFLDQLKRKKIKRGVFCHSLTNNKKSHLKKTKGQFTNIKKIKKK